MFTFRVSEYQNLNASNHEAPINYSKTTGTYYGVSASLQKTTTIPDSIIPTNTAGTVTATLPTDLELEIIYYAGESFRADEFTYDPTTGAISFTSSSTSNGNALTYLFVDNATLFTTYTNESISAFLKSLNVDGTVTISSRLGDHPSLSLDFSIDCDQTAFIENQLCPGLEKLILGNWRIASVTTEDSGTNQLRVSLTARGIWAAYNDPSRSDLDKPVGLKQGNEKFLTIGQIAGLAGVPYAGANITVRIPRSISSQDFTTVREVVEQRAVIYNGFVFYDDPSKVRVKNFGLQTVHVINDSDLVDAESNAVTTTYSGAGTDVQGVKLSNELRNALLELDFDTEMGSGQICRYEYINANNQFEVGLAAESKGVFDGPNEILVQPSIETLRSNARNYDTGGFFKEWIKITEFDGVPLQIERHVFGYNYSSQDTYVISGTNNEFITFNNAEDPQNFWIEVLVSITNYVYDSQGYLIRTTTSGNQTARLRQETEDNEAVNLLAQALQAGLNLGDIPASPVAAQNLYNQSLAYTWTENLPITDETNYALRLFRDFYPDIEVPENDDDFIDPKFSERKIRFRNNSFLAENPDSTEVLELPPIVVEKNVNEEERQVITTSNIPERYSRKSQILNQEGASGINAIRESRNQQVVGRPPIHTRLEVEAQVQNNTGQQNYLLYKDNRYWLSTPGSGSTFDFTETTISYPDVDDPEIARAAAETEYTILNTLNSQTVDIAIRFRPNIKVGDTVIFRSRKYIVLSFATSRDIDYLNFNGIIALNLGRLPNLTVDLKEVKVSLPPF